MRPDESLPSPNRPKPRPAGQPLLTDEVRRRCLGSAFADAQDLAQAREYDALRPRYPQGAVRQIMELAPEGAPRIADLGAGTGILTRQLLAQGAWVVAVEPGEAMRQVLAETAAEHADRLSISQAPAERTGLGEGSAEIVVAAQAWHWFDAEAVQQEIARILGPGGASALIWNYLDTSDGTVHRLTRIMRAGDVYRPGWQPVLKGRLFGPVQTTEHRWSRSLTVGEIFRYATTLSSWLSAGEADRARRRANLEDYLLGELGLSEDSEVELPMITVLHLARLRSGRRAENSVQ